MRSVERWLERTYNLTQKPERSRAQPKNLTTGEYRQKERTGEKPPKEKLWEAIDRAASFCPTMPQLLQRLKHQGIDVKVGYTRTGVVKGISYELDEIAFSGSSLGAAYTFPGLQKHRGVIYSSSQDEAIREISSVPKASLPHQLEPQPQQQTPQSVPDQRALAQQLYPYAWNIFERAKRSQKAQEIQECYLHTGENYALVYNPNSFRFSIAHRERGELAQFEAGSLKSAQEIQQKDFEILRRHDQEQQRQLKLQPSQSQSKSMEVEH